MLNGKNTIIRLIVGSIKKTVLMSEYFLKLKSLGGKVKVKLSLSNYATKTDLKNARGIDTSSFAKKVDLANLKSNVDKLDIDKVKNVSTNLSNLKSKVDKLDVHKLVPAAVDLSKVIDIAKNDAKIKSIQDKIPDITNLATNTTLNAKINEVQNKIPSITKLATTTAINTKTNEIKNKIPSITNFTTTVLTAVENIIPNISNSVKDTDYNTKISETENKNTTDRDHDQHIASQECHKLI